MNKRVLTWVGRSVLTAAIVVAMVGPAIALHAEAGRPSANPVMQVGAQKFVVATLISAASSATTAHPLSTTYVYITKTGSKYHRSNCRYLRYSKRKVTLKYAKSHHYGACKICRPPK